MKRFFCLVLTLLCMSFLLISCRNKSETADNGDRLQIVTASFPLYDFTRAIAGDSADIQLLLKPGAETHSYEPTPKEIVTIRSCDLFLYIGGESDHWVHRLIGEGGSNALALIDTVDPLTEEHDHEEGDNEAGHHSVTYDEHIWTSPINAKKMVNAICEVLCRLRPETAAVYRAATEAYGAELSALDADIRQTVATAERTTLLFGDRFPFLYFAEEYGLDHYAAFPGCSNESEVSATTVAFLIRKVKEEALPVVFVTELSSGRIADSICSATGAQKRMLHSAANISRDEAEAGVTYLSLMRQNLTVLKEALGAI